MDTKITTKGEPDKQVTSSKKRPGIVESLAMPAATRVEFEPLRLVDKLLRLPDGPEWSK